MAAIGTNVVTSIARRYILPQITDNIYKSNLIFFRLTRANKKLVQGGTQIEAPLMYAKMAAGGWYTGLDLLDTTPTDAVKNGVWDWKQAYVPVTVDGLTLIKTDQPIAIANFIKQYFAQAQMELADILGDGLFSDGTTNTKKLDGFKGAVDDTTVLASYAGITRSTDTWWKSQVDTTAYTGGSGITLSKLQAKFGAGSEGGRHPTIQVSTQGVYDIYWNLNTSGQRFPSEPAGHDEQLAQAGFTNLLFNGVPWVVDSHVPANHLFMLNEDYLSFCVSPRADFYVEDFQIPVNQDAMVAKLLWAGNLVLTNAARQVKFTNIQA
jgi:hypothetical protein